MINKQTILRIVEKANSREFGSGKYHIYISYGDGSAIEECECGIIGREECLEVQDFDDESIIWIPYEQITEISIVNDIAEEED